MIIFDLRHEPWVHVERNGTLIAKVRRDALDAAWQSVRLNFVARVRVVKGNPVPKSLYQWSDPDYLLIRELLLLAIVIDDHRLIDAAQRDSVVRRWSAMIPSERWWLFSMMISDVHWRKGIGIAMKGGEGQ